MQVRHDHKFLNFLFWTLNAVWALLLLQPMLSFSASATLDSQTLRSFPNYFPSLFFSFPHLFHNCSTFLFGTLNAYWSLCTFWQKAMWANMSALHLVWIIWNILLYSSCLPPIQTNSHTLSNCVFKIIGLSTPHLFNINSKAMICRERTVTFDPWHPLNSSFTLLPSGRRSWKPACFGRSLSPLPQHF